MGVARVRVARAALVARAVLVVQEHEADGHRADGEADEDAELHADRQRLVEERVRLGAPRVVARGHPAKLSQGHFASRALRYDLGELLLCPCVCLFVRMFHFFSKSSRRIGPKFYTDLCYDNAQLTKQDGIRVMNN